jgi:hypothetical protein
MSDIPVTEPGDIASTGDEERQSRRDFLVGLGRWSKIVIGAAVFGGLAASESDAQAGAWINNRGGGGGWINGGGGGWINNRGGGGWINNRGGGGWINRR